MPTPTFLFPLLVSPQVLRFTVGVWVVPSDRHSGCHGISAWHALYGPTRLVSTSRHGPRKATIGASQNTL